MQRAGGGIRSLAEPYLDTTSDFAEIVFGVLGVASVLREAGAPPHRGAHRARPSSAKAMSTEAVEGTGLPVSADAGIAEAAVFRVSPGYFLRQIYPLDPAGEDTTACG